MTEQSPGTESGLRPWLARHWRFALVLAALWGVELALALRTGANGGPVIYWLYILNEQWPDAYLYATEAAALLSITVMVMSDRLKWPAILTLIFVFLIPLPVAQFSGGLFRFPLYQHAGSMGFCGRVYQVTYQFLSGSSVTVYECDRYGLVCRQAGYFYSIASQVWDDPVTGLHADGNQLVYGSGEYQQVVRICTLDGPAPPPEP